MESELRILILEDDPDDARLMRHELRKGELAHVTRCVTHKEEFLAALAEFKPDVILSDHKLPGFTGVEALQLVRQRYPELPFILVTGALGEEAAVATIQRGATDYILKDRLFKLVPAVRRAAFESRQRIQGRQAEARFRNLLDAAPDAMVIVNEGYEIVLLNSETERMFGYTRAELLGQTIEKLLPDRFHDLHREHLSYCLVRGGSPPLGPNTELSALRKDGTEFAVEIGLRPLETETAMLVTVAIRDITRRKEAEARLRESEERFRQMAENIHEVFWMTDLGKNQMLYISPGYETVWGRASLYASPRDWMESIHPGDRERVRPAALEKQLAGEYHEVYRITRPDGSVRWIEDRAFPVRNELGKVYRVVGIAEDITERKRGEARMVMLAQAVEGTAEMICITDMEDRFVFVNRAFLEAYGYTEAEILGRTPELLFSPQNPPSLAREIFAQTRLGGWRGEVLDRRKDGKEFPVSLTTSQIRDPAGGGIGLIGVSRDITERKKAEKQSAAFGALSFRLSAAANPQEAARIILEVASELFGWEAGYVHLYSQAKDRITRLLTVDTIDGERRPVPPLTDTLDPSPLMRLVMREGARLINREDEPSIPVNLVPYGALNRRSSSRMFVPVHSRGGIVGILSIQSYRPQAYSPEDLKLLQTLADHCGDTLERIRIAQALGEAEAKYRSIFENATEGIFQTTPQGRHLGANPALARMFGYTSPEDLIASVTDIERQTYVVPQVRAELKRLLEAHGSVQGFEAERYRKDGSKFWGSVTARTVRDARGEVLYYEGTERDVTQRKEMLNALRESERKLRLIAENTEDVIFAFDLGRRMLYVNPAVEALTGYTAAEVQGEPFLNRIHRDDRERMLEHWEELFEGKGRAAVEYRLVTKGGQTKWCSSSWGPLLDESGHPIGVQGRERDITERKRAEQHSAAFAALSYRLSAAASPNEAARIILDVASELFGWDAAYVDLYSRSEDKVIPILTFDTISGERREIPEASLSREPSPLMRMVMETGGHLVRRAKGESLAVPSAMFGDVTRASATMMYVAVRSGSAVSGILSVQSYTPGAYSPEDLALLRALADHCGNAVRRIEMAEALRKAEEKFRTIFENATEGIFQTTPEGRLIGANPALARIFGYGSVEEMVSSVNDVASQVYVAPEQRLELRRLLNAQGSVQGFQAENYRKDGRRIWISLNGHAVRDAAGAIQYYEGTIQDITDRKTLERDLLDLSTAERRRFGYDLHDGLGQHLTGIALKAKSLEQDLAAAGLPQVRRANDVVRLINQAISQTRSLAHSLDPLHVDASGLVAALGRLSAETKDLFSLECVFTCRQESLEVSSEVGLALYRITQEAIYNATRHGQARRILVDLGLEGGQLRLRIEDDGRGFDLGSKPESGIGLRSMQYRANSLGGPLTIQSRPGAGTEIVCLVPVPKRPEPAT